MTRRVTRTISIPLLILATCLRPVTCSASPGAQLSGVAVSPAGTDPGEAESGSSTRYKENSHTSVTERFLANMRSPIGFSMGLFELYVPGAGSEFKSNLFTMVRPRLFTRARTRRSQFQADYSFGYRRYNHRSQIRSTEHSAVATYAYQISRRVSFHVSDDFRSQFNDGAVLPSSSAPTLYQPSFAQGLYLPGERYTMNSLVTGLTYRAGKRSNLTAFTGYDLWRYSSSTFGNSYGIQAGMRIDLQISKWLFLDSSYSHYLNVVPLGFQSTNIQRLQAGGLKVRPTRNVELYVSGGVDSTRFLQHQQTIPSLQGGISRTSGSTLLTLVYHRGFSVAVGPQTTLAGDIVTASISQWLSSRVNINTTSSYTRGDSLDKHSKVEYLWANAELQIVMQRHVLFFTQYSLVTQHGRNLPSDNLLLSRYTVATGLQFIFPSLGGRERGSSRETRSNRLNPLNPLNPLNR